MISETQRFKHLIFALLIPVAVWAVASLTGCGGVGDIPAASVLSSGQVTLSWDPIPGAASYNVYLATSPGVTPLNSFKISNVSNPITITDLEPGTTYYFIVGVEDDSGASRHSQEVAYTVADAAGSIDFGPILNQIEPEEKSVPPEAAPAAADKATKPQEKAAAASGKAPDTSIPKTTSPKKPDSERRPSKAAKSPKPEKSRPANADNQETQDVTLAWDNVPNAASYNIYWSDKPGVTRQNGTKIADVQNPYKMKGLKKGKKYYFVVTAVNASGESQASAEFSFTVGQ
jgi:fibronectin type 3 domain-containing protein